MHYDHTTDQGGDGSKRGKGLRLFNQFVEDKLISKVSYAEYRDKVKTVYDGPQGAILSTCSRLSLHLAFGERLLKHQKFVISGVEHILDVGCGAGQITQHILKYADADTRLTCVDLSAEMLRRARQRLRSDRPDFLAADVTCLPFEDESFDCVTCGYVLEHLPDPRMGLVELYRVMRPGARMLLLTSEDSFGGAWTSRFWKCRTYNRRELREVCKEIGLDWKQELWFSRLHKLLRAGGICVELEKG